jgi:cytoskeletal protein RodZ
MENIGELLKNRRLELNKSLTDIYEQIRIAPEHLRFLEENNFVFLPETYVKSYLKTYSNALGLRADEILSKHRTNQAEVQHANEEEITTQPEQTKSAPPKNLVLEWALAAGTLILLISIILVYLQYRSQIYARPLSNQNNIGLYAPTQVATQSAGNGHESTSKPIELQIKAFNQVGVQLVIDGEQAPATQVAPDQTIIWNAEHRLDLIIHNAEGINLKVDNREISNLGVSGGKVRLSIVKNGEAEKIRRKTKPSS